VPRRNVRVVDDDIGARATPDYRPRQEWDHLARVK
jgi:hypothetical protein